MKLEARILNFWLVSIIFSIFLSTTLSGLAAHSNDLSLRRFFAVNASLAVLFLILCICLPKKLKSLLSNWSLGFRIVLYFFCFWVMTLIALAISSNTQDLMRSDGAPAAATCFLLVWMPLMILLAIVVLLLIEIFFILFHNIDHNRFFFKSFVGLFENLKAEFVFLTLAFIFGWLFVIITPPFQVPDENHHFNYAYAISIGQMSGYKSVIPVSINELMKLTASLPFYPEGKISLAQVLAFLDVPLTPENLTPSFYQSVAKVNPAPYILTALLMNIARQFDQNVLVFFYAGRLFNLGVWIFVSYAALRQFPVFKWSFVFLTLTPMSLAVASSYSADAITNSICFLWISLCFKYAVSSEKELDPLEKFAIVGVSALLFLIKPPYFLLSALFFMIPRQKFGNSNGYIKVVAFLVLIGIMLTIFSMTYLRNDLSNTNSNPSIDFVDQIKFIYTHPISFFQMIIRSIGYNWIIYIKTYIGVLGWLDTPLPEFVYFSFPFVVVFVLINEKWHLNTRISLWQKQVVVLTAGMIVFLIFLSLYITWTPVGENILYGMQGRYLIPVSLLLVPICAGGARPKKNYWTGIVAAAYLVILLTTSVNSLVVRYYTGVFS